MEVQIKSLLGVENSSTCLLPKSLFGSLNLSSGIQYNIHLGQLSQQASIDIDENNEGAMLIPKNMLKTLLLPEGLTLNIRGEGGDIYLGPVIGIFINHYNYPAFINDTVPKYNFRGSLAEKCLCYYFSTNDILWEEKKIKGYTLSPDTNMWVSGWFPLPNVVYDRGVGFEKEEKPLVKEIRNKFKNYPSLSIFNKRSALGKWETYDRLAKYPEMSSFLPKTCQYSNFNDVIMMLKQHEFVFLKSSFGSGGKQVLSIEKKDGKYRLVFYSGGLKELFLEDIDELRSYVEEYTEDSKFVIQEGIKLIKYNNQVMDMRILIIKDRNGRWKVIYNFARIAKSNLTITNYSAGGDGAYYENIYENLRNQHPEGVVRDYNEIGEATVRIAEYIEKAFGNFGELGMDIGMDMNGKLWFIEANTKPDKDLSEEFDDLSVIPLQSYVLFQYCKYLANF